MTADPTPMTAEAVEVAYAAAYAEATRRVREMTGNPALDPSALMRTALRREVEAALSAAAPILLAAGRTAAERQVRAELAEEIARAIEAAKPSPHQFWDTADAARVYALVDAAKIARKHATTPAERPPAGDARLMSNVIAVSNRFAAAARGEQPGHDWVRLRTGSGRTYEGYRSPTCPGDGQPGHQHDIRCISDVRDEG